MKTDGQRHCSRVPVTTGHISRRFPWLSHEYFSHRRRDPSRLSTYPGVRERQIQLNWNNQVWLTREHEDTVRVACVDPPKVGPVSCRSCHPPGHHAAKNWQGKITGYSVTVDRRPPNFSTTDVFTWSMDQASRLPVRSPIHTQKDASPGTLGNTLLLTECDDSLPFRTTVPAVYDWKWPFQGLPRQWLPKASSSAEAARCLSLDKHYSALWMSPRDA